MRSFALATLLLAGTNVFGSGLVNSWTSSGSGYWHDLSWSLGVRPDLSQAAVVLTNNGIKSVTITAVTASNFPSSMLISNLTVAGDANSTNRVVLDHPGSQTPLQILEVCMVGSNGALVNLEGVLKLDGGARTLLVNGGEVDQSGGSNIFGGLCRIGYLTNYGSYNLTNGSTLIDSLQIGDSGGGLFNQFGGELVVHSDVQLTSANYALYDGAFSAAWIEVGLPSAGFDANFFQGGGASSTYLLSVGNGSAGNAYLTNGLLSTGRTEVGVRSLGLFDQTGGTHETEYLQVGDTGGVRASYVLHGGCLSSRNSVILGQGAVFQDGGTNESEILSVNSKGNLAFGAGYELSGGLLACSNVNVSGSSAGHGLFVLSEGAHRVSNQLAISGIGTTFGNGRYGITGGNLHASIIRAEPFGFLTVLDGNVICNELILDSASQPGAAELTLSGGSMICSNLYLGAGRVLAHSGGMLTNFEEIIFDGGTLQVDNVTERWGAIVLNATSTNALSSSPCTQRFASSAHIDWSPQAVLHIAGWKGSLLGNGLHRIYVGNSRYALTYRQLEQIRFLNPAGLPAGTYLGTLLDSGELVPTVQPAIIAAKSEDGLSLVWPSNWGGEQWSLQSATNVAGPYWDVFPAVSPLAVLFTGDHRFFKLRNGNPWAASDIGTVSFVGSASATDGLWTLRGDGVDIWGITDAFHYAYQPWSGNGSIVARVVSCQNTDPWAKGGVMFRASTNASAPNYTTVVSAASGSQAQWRSSLGAMTFNDWAGNTPIPYWVMVARNGNTFLGCVSSDGVTWKMLAAQSIAMADPIYAGLISTSHSSNAISTATFDNLSFSRSIAPLPWADAAVGSVYAAGTSTYSNGTYRITSYGFDCWSTADQFQSLYQPVTGDASLTVHLASLQSADPWAKAGVMFRNNLSSGSQYSGTILSSGHGTVMQRRFLANDGTLQTLGPNLQAPCWLGVIRRGNVFYNYVSADGTNWTQVGNSDTVTMGATAYAVVFVTTHSTNPSVSETASFDFVNVSQP